MTVQDTETAVAGAVRERLRGVIDPCCRDRGISIVDMGLLDAVSVDDAGRATVRVMLTSGWCPFQVDLVGEVSQAALAVDGVSDVDVRITLDRVWSPALMSAGARAALRLLPEPAEAGSREAYLAAHPRPRALPLVAVPPARPVPGGVS